MGGGSFSMSPICWRCPCECVCACVVRKCTSTESKNISPSLKLAQTEIQQRSCCVNPVEETEAGNSLHVFPKTIRLGGPSDSWVIVWYVHFQMLDWQYAQPPGKSMVQGFLMRQICLQELYPSSPTTDQCIQF